MTSFIASLKSMPPRRAVGRVMGYGLFGTELIGSILVGLAVMATVVSIMRDSAAVL